MTTILYTGFLQKISSKGSLSISRVVQHYRWKPTALPHEAGFHGAAEFKLSQMLTQSQKRWIKLCRWLVPVPAVSEKRTVRLHRPLPKLAWPANT